MFVLSFDCISGVENMRVPWQESNPVQWTVNTELSTNLYIHFIFTMVPGVSILVGELLVYVD